MDSIQGQTLRNKFVGDETGIWRGNPVNTVVAGWYLGSYVGTSQEIMQWIIKFAFFQ